MTAPADIEALAVLLEAATPGPWEHAHEGLQGGEVIRGGDIRVARVYKSNWPDYRPDCENAALIAAAVNALPALLAEVKASREALARVEDAIDREESRGCHYRHQQGETDECNGCTAARISIAALGSAS